MSVPNSDLALAMHFAVKLREGKPFTEQTFAECFRELSPTDTNDSPEVSAKWRNHLWNTLREVPVREFLAATKEERTLVKLLLEIWGK